MRRAAWVVRLQLITVGILLLTIGFVARWLTRTPFASSSPTPSAAPTGSASLPPGVPAPITRFVKTPVCGPRGVTRADIELACREGWLHTDEARLLGIEAKPNEYTCTLADDEDSQLLAEEDRSVSAASAARAQGKLCAPASISADAVRLACKEERISSDFARALGIDAKPKSALWSRTGCVLAPSEAQALERDEAAAVRSR